MTSLSPTAVALQRLADQLQHLCALSETLTYRLLELEERLGFCEETLLAEGATPAVTGELEDRLGETEQRLARLEAALQAEPAVAAPAKGETPGAGVPPEPPSGAWMRVVEPDGHPADPSPRAA